MIASSAKVKKGFRTTQTVGSRQGCGQVERVSREVTQIMESGVRISSAQPSYYYTGLSALKIEMLAGRLRTVGSGPSAC